MSRAGPRVQLPRAPRALSCYTARRFGDHGNETRSASVLRAENRTGFREDNTCTGSALHPKVNLWPLRWQYPSFGTQSP